MADESTNQATQETEAIPGTTALLFADLIEPEQKVEEVAEPVKERQRDEKGKFVSKEAEVKAEPVADDYLPVEEIKSKKVKTKIDGVEGDVTFEELVRGYQTAQSLTKKGQQIAEEKKRLDEERKSLTRKSDEPAQITQTAEVEDEIYKEYVKPHVAKLEQKIKQLESLVESTTEALAPTLYETNIKKIDVTMKKQGYDDFMKYVPKIQDYILNLPVEEMAKSDTVEGYMSIYKDFKIKDLLGSSEKTSAPAEVRPKPKIVKVEGGNSTPSGSEEGSALRREAVKQAKASGSIRDWAKVFQVMDSEHTE